MIPTILLIEPAKQTAQSIKSILCHYNFLFIDALSDQDVQAAINNQAFDLILANCAWAQHHESRFPDKVPVVYLMEPSQLPQYEDWLLLENLDYLLTPVRAMDILLKINTYLPTVVPPQALLIMPVSESMGYLPVLLEAGIHSYQADTLDVAIKLFHTHHPDIVVLDASLSFDLIQSIHKDLQTFIQDKGLVFLSISSPELAAQPEFLSLEVCHTFAKPIWPRDVLLRFKQYLKKNKQDRPPSKKMHQTPISIKDEKEKLLQQIQVTLHHEIRNPLTSILIGSQALTHQFKEGTPEKAVLIGIETCSRRIKDVMDSLGNLKQLVVEDYMEGIEMLNLSKSLIAPSVPKETNSFSSKVSI